MTGEDSEIIQQVKNGNRNAYAELIRKYEARVRGYAGMMLADATQAEDAAQEIFIKAYESLDKFRGEASFSTWIYRIATNHCLDLLKKRKRTRTESWEALIEKNGDTIEAAMIAPNTAKPSVDMTELITQLLSHMPEISRNMLILREVQGLSYEELAQTLGCTLDSVKSRLKRARQELELKMRHFLKEEAV